MGGAPGPVGLLLPSRDPAGCRRRGGGRRLGWVTTRSRCPSRRAERSASGGDHCRGAGPKDKVHQASARCRRAAPMARLGGGDRVARRGGSNSRTASIPVRRAVRGRRARRLRSGRRSGRRSPTRRFTATSPRHAPRRSHGLTLAPTSPGRDLGRTRARAISFLVSLRTGTEPTCLTRWAGPARVLTVAVGSRPAPGPRSARRRAVGRARSSGCGIDDYRSDHRRSW